MSKNFLATAELSIYATPERIWRALTDPAEIKQYFFGTDVTTDWTVGGSITWAGEYEGKTYEDHGEILEVTAPKRLRMTHFSPLGGAPDTPENYHELGFEISPSGNASTVTLTQDNNPSEAASEHSKANWMLLLEGLKTVAEATP